MLLYGFTTVLSLALRFHVGRQRLISNPLLCERLRRFQIVQNDSTQFVILTSLMHGVCFIALLFEFPKNAGDDGPRFGFTVSNWGKEPMPHDATVMRREKIEEGGNFRHWRFPLPARL